MAPLIVAKDLYKCYPGFPPVLRGVNIEVEPGELVAIMGPSGCGKSTMLHILGMLHAPDAGSLDILGTNVLNLNREQTAAFRRGNMGFVMQASNLFEHSTVFENVEFPLIYENVPPQERWERVIHALNLVRLSSRVHYPGNRLSGGEQQRVAIARAMVNNPRILLADEPTGALDARTSNLIMRNFQSLCHSGGVAMVMVTHDPKMAEFCDSVYTLEDGILVNKKRGKPPFSASKGADVLKLPEPLARTALVCAKFPPGERALELAGRLHDLNVISRVYALGRKSLFGSPGGYALALPARHMGFWQKFSALIALMKRARFSQSIWYLWKKLPARNAGGKSLFRRLMAFACGARLARWGMRDNVQFFYGADGGRQATAAWVASAVLRVPFAFAMSGACLKFTDWPVKARDALFISCASSQLKKAILEAAPDLSEEKVIVLPDVLPIMPAENESHNASGFEILIAAHDAQGAASVFNACATLSEAVHFSVLAPRNKAMQKAAKVAGISHRTTFVDNASEEGLGDLYRTAKIFVWQSDARQAENMELPKEVAEAMAFALGIILFGSESLPPLLENGQNSIICQNSQNDLAKALSSLVDDAARREKLGANAKKSFFDWLDEQPDERELADRIVEAVGSMENKREGGHMELPRI